MAGRCARGRGATSLPWLTRSPLGRRAAADHPRGARLALAGCALLAATGLVACGTSDGGAVEALSAPPEFFGMMTQAPPSDEDFEQMSEGGVGILRAFFAWEALQPNPGADSLDFSTIDPVVAGAARERIEVLPYLFSSPGWVAELDGADCGHECAIHAPSSPKALDAWRDFVAAAAERYGPGGEFWSDNPDLEPVPVRTWQIWNEQNSPSAYGPEPDVEGYAKLLDVAADEIRAVDPDATLILGGMFGTPLQGEPPALTAPDFLRRLYALPDAADSFDGVAVHPYAAHVVKVESQIQAIRAEIERAADDAGVWVTEIGWSSDDGDDPLERGPQEQAERLTEAYTLLADNREEWDIRNVTWYSWRDNAAAEICEWCAHSGLFEEQTLTPKPAWDSYTELADPD